MTNPPRCECGIHKHRTTTIQRIAIYEPDRCQRRGRYVLFGHRFCKAHAKLFAEGFVDPKTLEMTDPQTMADIRRYRVRGPLYEKEVTALFGDEERRMAVKYGDIEA